MKFYKNGEGKVRGEGAGGWRKTGVSEGTMND